MGKIFNSHTHSQCQRAIQLATSPATTRSHGHRPKLGAHNTASLWMPADGNGAQWTPSDTIPPRKSLLQGHKTGLANRNTHTNLHFNECKFTERLFFSLWDQPRSQTFRWPFSKYRRVWRRFTHFSPFESSIWSFFQI